LLETLRHFARDHAGDLDALRRRHAAHYAAFAEQAGEGLTNIDELVWRRRVAGELDNLRAATSWAFDAPDHDDLVLGGRVLDGLAPEPPTLQATGMYALAAIALARVDTLTAAQRAVVFNAVAHDAFNRGHYEQAMALGTKTIADSETITFAWLGSLAMVTLATLAAGDLAATRVLLAEGRRRLETDGASDWLTACIYSIISTIASLVGDEETAISSAEQNLAIARRVGAPTLLANALTNHALAIEAQNPHEALVAAEEAMRLVEAGAGANSYSGAAWSAAKLRSAEGDTAGAARAISANVEHIARVGKRGRLTESIRVATLVLAASPHDFEVAATLIGATDGPVLGHNAPILTGRSLERYDRAVADVAAALGEVEYTKARQHGAAMTYDEIVAYTL